MKEAKKFNRIRFKFRVHFFVVGILRRRYGRHFFSRFRFIDFTHFFGESMTFSVNLKSISFIQSQLSYENVGKFAQLFRFHVHAFFMLDDSSRFIDFFRPPV